MHLTIYLPENLARKFRVKRKEVNASQLFQEAFRQWLTDGGDRVFHFKRSKQLKSKLVRIQDILDEPVEGK